jgi:hypothetical protein
VGLIRIKYLHRVLFITIVSMINSLLAFFETLVFDRQVKRQRIHPEIIFIVGHPRTGTTLLHNLMSLDDSHGHVTTFQVAFPSAFLILDKILPLTLLKLIENWLMDDTRPMDGLPLDFSTPAEDEIATNMLSGGISPYGALSFMPRYAAHYARFVAFHDCTAEEIRAWSEALIWFLKKVSLANRGKPLILKSPTHAARIPILKQLFPSSKFVFIARDPITVFMSSCHLVQQYYTYCWLTPLVTDEMLTEYILSQHSLLYKELFKAWRDRDKTKTTICAVSFKELENNPLLTIERIYDEFRLKNRPKTANMERYLRDTLSGFKKNDHKPLPPNLLLMVKNRTEWIRIELDKIFSE